MREPFASRQLALGLLLAVAVVTTGGLAAAHAHDAASRGEPCALCIIGDTDIAPAPGGSLPAATTASSEVPALPSAPGGREPRTSSGPRAPPTPRH